MKPHVRYGHTPHLSMAGGGAGPGGGGRALPFHRRAAEDGPVDSAMIEEYKLEEQLAPFYETSSERAASVRCFPAQSGAPPSSAPGNKPTLRTVSIMETLSELTGSAGGGVRRRPAEMSDARDGPPASASPAKSAAGPARRKKTVQQQQPDMAELLDLSQWYPAVPKPPVTTDRVWDVSRINAKLNLSAPSAAAPRLNKGRSVQDVLSAGMAMTSSNTQGYGSLERRRRRRPGARAAFAHSARRGETDWEREEDEDEEDLHRLNETIHCPIGSSSVSSVLQRGGHRKTVTAPEPVARQSYRPPTEWFKKKRSVPPATLPKPSAVVPGIGKPDSHARERGQTPDWIHKIFHVARRGNLVKLVTFRCHSRFRIKCCNVRFRALLSELSLLEMTFHEICKFSWLEARAS